jgi:hypothetical protein
MVRQSRYDEMVDRPLVKRRICHVRCSSWCGLRKFNSYRIQLMISLISLPSIYFRCKMTMIFCSVIPGVEFFPIGKRTKLFTSLGPGLTSIVASRVGHGRTSR